MEEDTKPKSPIRRLYQWFLQWADKPNAEKALFGFSFAESSFFPIPPDPLLMAMVFAKTKRWIRYAAITTVASILGGIRGIIIGVGLFESLGNWILDTYHLHEEYAELGVNYENNAFVAVLAAAMTPIPYKIITISAGAFKINFVSFIIASIIGRSARFFGVSALASYLGKKHKEKIERYIDFISLGLVILLVLLLLIL